MDFLEKLINEIKRLEGKYGSLTLVYENGEVKKDFDLLSLNNEKIGLILYTETERNILKAVYYSYAMEYFAGKELREELDLQFPIGKTLALNSVLLGLIRGKVNFRYQVENYVDRIISLKDGGEYAFLKELCEWYVVSIINKRLPYRVTMDLLHNALSNNSNLIELKKAIFVDSSMAIISTAYRFLELTDEEVRVVKCSILFSFLEEAKARRLVDTFLKEITYEYEEKDYSRSDILLKVIASFGKNKYQQFEERFRNYKVWKSTNFTNNINNFEEIMVANFNINMDNINEDGEGVNQESIDNYEVDEEEINIRENNNVLEEITFETIQEEDVEENLESTQVIDVNTIREQYNIAPEEVQEFKLEVEPVNDISEKDNVTVEYNEEETINEIMSNLRQAKEKEKIEETNIVDDVQDEEVIEEIEEILNDNYSLDEEKASVLDNFVQYEEEVIALEEKEISELLDYEVDNLIGSSLEKRDVEIKEVTSNDLIDMRLSESVHRIDYLGGDVFNSELEELRSYNLQEIKHVVESKETREEEKMNNTEGLDDLIGFLMPAEKLAERNLRARNERVKKELKVIIEAIQSTQIESAVNISFVPLKEVIDILMDKNYKVERGEKSITVLW